MKTFYKRTLKRFFHEKLVEYYKQSNRTYAQIAESLYLDDHSVSNLMNGHTGCSDLTLALFLVYLCPDPTEFINSLRIEFEKEDNHVA